jgi:hypothetical protein
VSHNCGHLHMGDSLGRRVLSSSQRHTGRDPASVGRCCELNPGVGQPCSDLEESIIGMKANLPQPAEGTDGQPRVLDGI